MPRLILTLEEQDKAWLEQQAAQRGVSMAEIIRMSLHSAQQQSDAAFDQFLKKTSGVWRKGDGLEYQRKIRSDWE